MKENEGKLKQQLTEELSRLEKWGNPPIPDLAFFEQLVAEEKKRIHQQLIRELFYFALTAAVILCFVAVMLIRLPVFFLLLQVPVLVAAVLFLFYPRKKEGEVE
ncbi:YxlC family protein [Fictibacillus enclensis]|uniref:YxlC family protein n=1 Tax=Fictibacillus enclensis TaxID=1017270 RepID=UPI0025A2478F|nr:YxlC family protein [Fictibacillus enclensis]MDM5336968.1 YxlC family protein [Fictibacillus enclensis]